MHFTGIYGSPTGGWHSSQWWKWVVYFYESHMCPSGYLSDVFRQVNNPHPINEEIHRKWNISKYNFLRKPCKKKKKKLPAHNHPLQLCLAPTVIERFPFPRAEFWLKGRERKKIETIGQKLPWHFISIFIYIWIYLAVSIAENPSDFSPAIWVLRGSAPWGGAGGQKFIQRVQSPGNPGDLCPAQNKSTPD